MKFVAKFDYVGSSAYSSISRLNIYVYIIVGYHVPVRVHLWLPHRVSHLCRGGRPTRYLASVADPDLGF